METLLFDFSSSEDLVMDLCKLLPAQLGEWTLRDFPDGESYVRIVSECADKNVILLCSLDRPNSKILPLIYAAETLHELGAKRVGLIAPYLGYMRKDKRFQSGEAMTARSFAKIVSTYFDWIATVDPHLHRYHSMDEIYSIPARVVHAAPVLADWLGENIERPLLIGPDSESEQWVQDVARRIDAPHLVLEKIRRGDRDVSVSIPNLDGYDDYTPVLVDDIISTGQTLLAASRQLVAQGMSSVVCAAIHGVYSKGALRDLRNASVAQIVTSNTINNETAAMNIASELAVVCKELVSSE